MHWPSQCKCIMRYRILMPMPPLSRGGWWAYQVKWTRPAAPKTQMIKDPTKKVSQKNGYDNEVGISVLKKRYRRCFSKALHKYWISATLFQQIAVSSLQRPNIRNRSTIARKSYCRIKIRIVLWWGMEFRGVVLFDCAVIWQSRVGGTT